jgi:anti-anti-sigma regulatory factor
VIGEFDMATAPDLGCLLGALIDRGHTDVVLDLANLVLLDSWAARDRRHRRTPLARG